MIVDVNTQPRYPTVDADGRHNDEATNVREQCAVGDTSRVTMNHTSRERRDARMIIREAAITS